MEKKPEREAARDTSRGAHLTPAQATGPCTPIDKEARAAGAPGWDWEGRGGAPARARP